ncbi:replication-relaxation family protein [Streptomyces europaeiscabiei]|uniref:replication-relaxation family protein n=1 Tax=Streptomyces europaeiscabiei TaxID=146819 RepID=UPI0029B67851|nr:replication-relaxation family protein [Streptomyces europaeiscabiei]MDX3695965.1 replication-relaxation family protein [Streptomyces europaeiscabiei]
MELSARDLEILKLTDTFSQLASTHLTELVFADRSHSVPDRVLGRLVRLGYLSRVGRRVSGDKGGAGAYAYQLGRYGRILLGVEARPSPNVNNHALLVADTYVELRRAERLGVLRLTRWDVELSVPPVRADLFAAVDFLFQHRSSRYFLEIDLATERPVRISEKLTGYWQAAEASTEEFFPYVVFVVVSPVRKAELERLVRQLPEERREMVRVVLFPELIPRLMQL